MMDISIEQLFEPDLRELFMQFPMPLAMVDRSGRTQVNERFARLFDRARLAGQQLTRILENNSRTWQPVRIAALNGAEIDLYAQALPMRQGSMVVMTESSSIVHDKEVDGLRQRIVELERVSSTDYLTGAWNRAHLVRVAASEMARSVRFRQPLSALLIDLDRFKRINDTLGHQTGDKALCALVDLIHHKIRSADLLFRWGGEEFVVLAVSTGYRDAETLAEHLRARVAGFEFPGIGKLTISIGVAERSGDETAEQWFKRLDAALFAAKNGGRNRVVADRRGDSDRWLTESGLAALRLVWRENYACGDPQIDLEHRELFELANKLIDAALPGQMRQAGADSDAALLALMAHLSEHFAHEEELLEKRGYSRLEEHRQAHASLLRKAHELRTQAIAGTASFGSLVDFLATDVVARHLFTADRDYFPLFASGGN